MTNVRIVEEVLFFLTTDNLKTEKQTIKSLSSCEFDAGVLTKGKGS